MSEQTAPALPIEGLDDVEYVNLGEIGEQHLVRFPNGYGASVVRGPYTYGGSEGLYEVGVIVHDPRDRAAHSLTYDTPITDDVLGWQSLDEVAEVLLRISRLPSRV